jgi:hypothetical protein
VTAFLPALFMNDYDFGDEVVGGSISFAQRTARNQKKFL